MLIERNRRTRYSFLNTKHETHATVKIENKSDFIAMLIRVLFSAHQKISGHGYAVIKFPSALNEDIVRHLDGLVIDMEKIPDLQNRKIKHRLLHLI